MPKVVKRKPGRPPAPPTLEETVEMLEAAVARRTYSRMEFFEPYEKQQQFFDLGAAHRERLLMAGNQQGKSEAGAFETACHLTGNYPDWWLGRRFDLPVRAWAAGESSTVVRDVQQRKLCGSPGVEAEFGTGLIPKPLLIDKSLARGVTDAFDTIQVRHKSGGISTLSFKSYEQGRTKFQGEPIHLFWGDEEPPMDIYTEMIARITATRGIGYITFTPLKGMSDVVIRYLNEKSEDRAVVTMTIKDAKHIPEEERARIIAGYPAHEREARVNGVPMLGSGKIFPYSEEGISEPALEHIPAHWLKLWGCDFGTDHPFAAVLILWDRDNDCIHVHACVRVSDQLPLQHAAAIKPIGAAVPVAWPQDGHVRREWEGELKSTAMIYKKHGLRMLDHHATFPDGGNSTEAGIMEMQERMTTGRFKVASHLAMWWEEFRMYHREDGKIVKIRDDLMSASRIAVMAKRHGQLVALGGQVRKAQQGAIARDVDFDLG